MAEAAGLALGGIALASLFSTCIECFGYFKSFQNADDEIKMELIKLDLEKARLLIWEDQVGIFKTEGNGRSQYLDPNLEVVEAIFRQIIEPIGESEKKRDKFGLRLQTRASQETEHKMIASDDISRNSMKIAVVSRNLNKAIWAISDQEKFQALLPGIKDLIDSLNQLVRISRVTIESVVSRDLVDLVGNLSTLRLVEEAWNDSGYKELAEKARTIIEQSEAGTLDFRTSEELEADKSGARLRH